MSDPSLVRKNGQLDVDTEAVLKFADKEYKTAERIVGVNPQDHDEVKSLVLEGVWRWWIPEATRRLQSGQWKAKDLPAKLRTALHNYTISKATNEGRKRSVRERCLRELQEMGGAPTFVESSQAFLYTKEEEQFLARLLRSIACEAKNLGRQKTRAIMRIMVLIRRATQGVKGGGTGWTWSRLFKEAANELPEEE